MKEKRVFYCEISYIVGIIVLALGTAFMERANFGMSMVVAPAYLIHLKVSEFLPFFTFGMSEYVFQAFILGVLALVMKKFKKSYFLSFVTAFIYGIVLDAVMYVVGLLTFEGIGWNIVFFVLGLIICATGVALLFHTYLPPEAYELFVKEISHKYDISLGKIKTMYDCFSCVLSVVLTLGFYGTFIGVGWGTVVCTIFNGFLIGRIGKFLEIKFIFKDALDVRKFC